MSSYVRELECPECGRSDVYPSRICGGCGLELMSMAEFYPALWAYGCPDHEECREALEFGDGKLRCPRHGCAYLPEEQELDEPVAFDTFTIYYSGTHALRPIEVSIDQDLYNYTIAACPKCNPGGYYFDPDGPVSDGPPTLYSCDDKEGRRLRAYCRRCGLSSADAEYAEIATLG